jgi:hypothetical protein
METHSDASDRPRKKGNNEIIQQTSETIETVEQFFAALQSENLVLHLDVVWSVVAAQSRTTISEFRNEIATLPGDGSIVFRRIDCSPQSSPVVGALADWLNRQDSNRPLIHTGGGAILWIQSGKLVEFVDSAFYEGKEKLVARTNRLMMGRDHSIAD